jgi:hypothetical protein
MVFQILRQASIVAQLSLLLGILPLPAGVWYAVRPTEQRLALMRPLSLAAIFASLCGLLSGIVSIVRTMALSPTINWKFVTLGTAEALVPLFVAFACLAVGWLSVAVGLQRHR